MLGRTDGVPLSRDFGFFEAGMDSITSVELKSRLEAVLGAHLPATAAFEHPTIAALAQYLLDAVLPPADAGPAPAPGGPADGPTGTAPPEDQLSPELDELSEEELLRLLGEELERDEP